MAKSVLVIGAVLLDVIGKAREANSTAVDKIGNINLSIGGVAFNVAVNLKQLGHDCQLFTSLRGNSAVSSLIKSSISKNGVKIDYLIEGDHLSEAAFMSIILGSEMSAITSSPIDSANLLISGKLKAAIARSGMVVADSNLSADQIKIVHGLCAEMNVDFCIVSASDSKASRILESGIPGRSFALVAMNEREARSLGVVDTDDHRSVCSMFSATRVLLSKGRNGSTYYDAHGAHQIPAPNVEPISTMGAGDALFSAICSCILNRKIPYSGDGLAVVTDTVSHVLRQAEPNIGESSVTHRSPYNIDSLVGLFLVISTIVAYGIGLTVGLRGIAEHWVSTIAASAVAGAIGAWIFNVIKQNDRDSARIVSGSLVGLATCVASSIPSLAGGDLVDPSALNQSQLVVHFILSTALALFAGLGLSRAVDRLISRATEV